MLVNWDEYKCQLSVQFKVVFSIHSILFQSSYFHWALIEIKIQITLKFKRRDYRNVKKEVVWAWWSIYMLKPILHYRPYSLPKQQ